MISPERLEKLKQIFVDDGVTLTDAKALEIGLWLLARIRPVLTPIPLDKRGEFTIIKGEIEAIRRKTPFVNLHDWRRKHVKNKPATPNPDVSP